MSVKVRQGAILSGVILFSGLVASLGSPQRIILVLGLVLAALGAVVLLRSSLLTFSLLIISSQLFPLGLSTGTETRLDAAVLLSIVVIGLWVLKGLIGERKWILSSSRPAIPLIVFSFVVILALFSGQISYFRTPAASLTAQIGGAMIFLLSFWVFIVLGQQPFGRRELEILTWAFFSAAAVLVAIMLVPGLHDLYTRIFPLGTPGSLFWVWMASMAFSQIVFNHQLRAPARIFLALLLFASFYYTLVWSREWLGGWAPAVIAILTILMINSSSRARIILLLLGVIVLASSTILYSTITGGDNPYSLSSRLEAWRVLGNLILANPLFGSGPANYYWYTRIFPIWGNYVSFNSHNNYMDILIQTGILGLICFIWFFYESARLGWKLRTTAPAGFERAFVYGALGGLAGTAVAAMFGDWVIPFVYNVGLAGYRFSLLAWLFLAGLVLIERNQASTIVQIPIAQGAEG